MNKGFTLAETLVTISILAIASAILITFYITGLRIYKEKTIERDLIFTTENMLKEISNTTKSATTFINQKVLNSVNFSSDSDTLILEIPSTDVNGKTLYTSGSINDFDYVVYDRVNNNIIKNIYPSVNSSRVLLENRIIASNVTNFTFTFYPNNPPTDWAAITKINVSVTARKIVGNTSKQIQLNQTIKSRNN